MLTIAIIGRPNVGKSTLFNRLMGARLAVVSPTRGTTRDRLIGTINWHGQPVALIDMGGVDPSAEGEMAEGVQRQIERGLKQADVIALVADGQDGLLPADEHLLARLRKLGKPILLAVNKLEARPVVPPEFLKLGLDEPTPISALHGQGIGELLDRLIAAGPHHGEDESAERAASPVASIAIVGRQNVGKSSLLNRLLEDERAIISDVPGTTRDTIDTLVTVKGKVIRLVDTAGLRHRRKVRNPVDYFAMGRTAEAIQRCDVAVLLIDGSLGIANDDRRIMTKVCDSGCGLILAVNKWDLAKGGKVTTLPDVVKRAVPQAAFAPVLPISAKTGFQVDRVIPEALRVAAAMRKVMTTEECTALLQAAWRKQPPSRYRGRTVTLKSAEWIAGRPVRIRVTTKPPGALLEPYRRFLLKHLHGQSQFVGVPIHFLTQETGIVLRPSRRGEKRPAASARRRNA